MHLSSLFISFLIIFSLAFQCTCLGSGSDSLEKNIPWAYERQRVFVQFWENPALTGTAGKNNLYIQTTARLGLNHRYNLAYDFRLGDSEQWGLGISYTHSAIGRLYDVFPWDATLMADVFQLATSYRFEINDHRLRPGLSIGYGVHKVDRENLVFGDQIDPGYGFVNMTNETFVNDVRGYWDINLGFEYLFKNYYLEIVLQHANQPSVGINSFISVEKPLELVVHTGLRMRVNNKMVLSPYVIYERLYYYNTITPGLVSEIGDKYIVGFSYMDLNTDTVDFGMNINKKLRALASLGFLTESRLAQLNWVGYSKWSITYFINGRSGA